MLADSCNYNTFRIVDRPTGYGASAVQSSACLGFHMQLDVEEWEGNRYERSPQPGFERLIDRFNRSIFFILVVYVDPVSIFSVVGAGPYLAAVIHYLGRDHVFHRLHYSYHFSHPRRSRAFIFADRWHDADERYEEARARNERLLWED